MDEPRVTGRAAVKMWLLVIAGGCLPIVLFSGSGYLAMAFAALVVVGFVGDLVGAAMRGKKDAP